MVWIVVGLLVIGAALWFFTRGSRTSRPNLPALRRELRKLTHDPGVADRLVDAEMKRHPDLAEAAILRRVIRRLRSDRRR